MRSDGATADGIQHRLCLVAKSALSVLAQPASAFVHCFESGQTAPAAAQPTRKLAFSTLVSLEYNDVVLPPPTQLAPILPVVDLPAANRVCFRSVCPAL